MANKRTRVNALGVFTVAACALAMSVAVPVALANALGWLDLRMKPDGGASRWLFVAVLTVVSVVIAYFATRVTIRIGYSDERLVVATLIKTTEIPKKDVESVVAESTDGSWGAVVRHGGGRVTRVFPLVRRDLERLLRYPA